MFSDRTDKPERKDDCPWPRKPPRKPLPLRSPLPSLRPCPRSPNKRFVSSLSDETRLRILFYLAQNSEIHVTDLCSRLGQSQPAVSHHLALLRVSGLIESRREGKHNFYSVRTDHFGELLVNLFSAAGDMPKKVKFHDFVLTYNGD